MKRRSRDFAQQQSEPMNIKAGGRMKSTAFIRQIATAVFAIALLFCAGRAQAQANSGTLRGTVTDPSGAAVVGATVTVTSSSGKASTATTGATGAYELRGLDAGQYQVGANAAGFQPFTTTGVAIGAGQAKTLDVPLAIER
jgi:hypothetical protein